MLRQCSTALVRSAFIGSQWQPFAAVAAISAGSWPCSAASLRKASTAAADTSRNYSAGMPANAMDLIKELRKTSGAPIADVKSCLAAASWDMDAAMEALRLKGLAAAVKKASRHASEGLVAVAQLGHELVSVVEINSETDFVGRSAPFQQLAAAAAQATLSLAPQAAAAAAGQVHEVDFQQLAAARLADGSSIEEGCALLAGQVRENIALRRGYLVRAAPHGVVCSYVHMPVAPGAGRIAAVVALQAENGHVQQAAQAQLLQLGSHLAMHSAGMNSQYVSRQAMPQAALEAARADLASAAEAQMPGKPSEVLAKIVDGKVAKWCKDVCLLDQKYILDDSLTIAQLLKQQAQQLELQGRLQVSGLLRLQVGEGLHRDDDGTLDFAAEVAAMAGSK
ncbi:elongation factor TS-domain-containing protein [Scenedesmus sp. NREL 46B-D3]|nr:elongation factor TS-domain-containing protein [Scenedesmus sp. NREL 46B-D3]